MRTLTVRTKEQCLTADLDRSVTAEDKRSVGALLAVRPWVFSMFESLRAPPAAAGQGRR
jgi:hypothetical protein